MKTAQNINPRTSTARTRIYAKSKKTSPPLESSVFSPITTKTLYQRSPTRLFHCPPTKPNTHTSLCYRSPKAPPSDRWAPSNCRRLGHNCGPYRQFQVTQDGVQTTCHRYAFVLTSTNARNNISGLRSGRRDQCIFQRKNSAVPKGAT